MYTALFHFTCVCQASTDSEYFRGSNYANPLKGNALHKNNFHILICWCAVESTEDISGFSEILKRLCFLYYSENNLFT